MAVYAENVVNKLLSVTQTANVFRMEESMILADKVSRLRKKNGWSQEELAEKMKVSRQAVSKWESAQTIPDLEKILQLGELFGVTTDYLLKDEMEEEEFTGNDADLALRRVTMSEANEYMEWRKTASVRIALATFLCILSPIPLLLLGAATETQKKLPEGLAAGIGLGVLLVLVAIAVGIYIFCDYRNAPYRFLENEPFDTEYGVRGMVKEKQKGFSKTYVKCNIIGTCLCVISPLPLFSVMVCEDAFLLVAMLAVTILLAGVGVVFLITGGVRFASFQRLLKEGEFTEEEKRKSKVKESVGGVYWLTATAIYLGWSFATDNWEMTWIVWPVAGVLFATLMVLLNLLVGRKEKDKNGSR